jgi:hypothetical protein
MTCSRCHRAPRPIKVAVSSYRHAEAEGMNTWPRCDSASCWCAIGPRIIASTGAVWAVEELPGDGTARLFRYLYLGGAA